MSCWDVPTERATEPVMASAIKHTADARDLAFITCSTRLHISNQCQQQSSFSSQVVAMSQPWGSHAAGLRDLGITVKIKRNIGAQLGWCGVFQHPGRSNLSKLLGLCFFSGQPTADPLEEIMGEKLELEFADSETITQWQNIHCVFVVNKDFLCNVRHGIHLHVRAYTTRE